MVGACGAVVGAEVVGGEVVGEVVGEVLGVVVGEALASGVGKGAFAGDCVVGWVTGGVVAGAVGRGVGATTAGAGAGVGAGRGAGAMDTGRGEIGEVVREAGCAAVVSGSSTSTGCSGTGSAGVAEVTAGWEVGVVSAEAVRSIESVGLASAVGSAGALPSTMRLSARPPATQAPTRIPDLQFTTFLVNGDGFGSLLITQLHAAEMRLGWVGGTSLTVRIQLRTGIYSKSGSR